jgi:hypothetical protein
MKKITLFLFLLTAFFGFSQTLPVDFELPEDEFSDSGSVFSIVDGTTNAPPTNSPNIGQIIGGGGSFDNVQLAMSTYIDVTNVSNNTITFDIYTPDTDVVPGLFQLTDRLNLQDGANVPIEVPFSTNGSIGWETITLDFDTATNGFPFCTGCGQDKPVVLDQYAKIVFFTDFNTNNTDTYFIDNIAGAQNGGSLDPPITSLSVDFETASDFSGAELTFSEIANPDTAGPVNTTANTGQVENCNVGPFANAQLSVPEKLDLSAGDKGFSLMVRGNRTVPIKLKLEGGVANEVDQTYTDLGNWQKLVFDFTADTSNSNNLIVLFFDISGAVSAPVSLDTFQFDEFVFDELATLSSREFSISSFNVFPNPSNNVWNVKTNDQIIKTVQVFDVLGKEVMTMKPNLSDVSINASTLSKGLYFAKITTELGSGSIKLIKN